MNEEMKELIKQQVMNEVDEYIEEALHFDPKYFEHNMTINELVEDVALYIKVKYEVEG